MNLNGVGAKVVVALLLLGPLTLEQLVEQGGVRRGKELWTGLRQAEELGLVWRVRAGRSVRYALHSSCLESYEQHTEKDNRPPFGLVGKVGSNIYTTYRTKPGRIIEPTGRIIEPDCPQTVDNGTLPGRIIEPDREPGRIIEPVGRKIEPSQPGVIIEPSPLPGRIIEPSPLDLVVAADRLPGLEFSMRRGSEYVVKRAAQREALAQLWAEVFPNKPPLSASTLDRLLLEAGNRAYFVAVVIQDMAASGKDIEHPVGYLTKTIKGRSERGDIPLAPLSETLDDNEMTPALRAQLDRADEEGKQYWRGDDE